MTVKRFEASLTTRNWPCNPERLVRKPDGDFVLYSDYANLEQAIKRIEEAHKATKKGGHVTGFEKALDSYVLDSAIADAAKMVGER